MTDDTKKKKKRGRRSKVFRSCFQSSVADDRPLSDDWNSKTGRSGKPVMIAVSGGGKGKDFISDANLVKDDVSDSGVDGNSKRSTSTRRRISRIFKAVLFDTAVSKKIRRSSSKSSIASDTSQSFLSSEKTGKECTDMDDSSSLRSYELSSRTASASSAISTSSISSINSNKTSSRAHSPELRHPVSSTWLSSTKPKPLPQVSSNLQPFPKPKPTNSISKSSKHKKSPLIFSPDSKKQVSSPEKIKSGINNLDIRLCLFLLLSLFVLVIWGRTFSILCTSIWFYLVPCSRIKRVNSATNTAEPLDIDSEQYKKRVIMVGLLERNRNSVR